MGNIFADCYVLDSPSSPYMFYRDERIVAGLANDLQIEISVDDPAPVIVEANPKTPTPQRRRWLLRLLGIFGSAAILSAQSCPHTLTRTPVGPVLIYQNGKLLNAGNYSSVTPAGKTMPTVAPLVFADQDAMSVVISRAVPLTFTAPPSLPVTYFSYALWREDWKCAGISTPPPVSLFPGCASDGARGFGCDGEITSGKSIQAGKGQQISGGVDFGGASGGRVGIAGADNAGSPFIVYLMPIGDGTGKFLHDAGVVTCPAFDASVIAKSPVCHQWEWATIPR